MVNNLERFLSAANALLAALAEYRTVTVRLCSHDLQGLYGEDLAVAMGEVERLIEEREEIRVRAEAAQDELIQVVDRQSDDDAQLIRGFFGGKEVTCTVSGSHRLVRDTILKLLAVQKEITDKDTEIIERMSNKRDETKAELKELQGDKKKLDFLNVTAAGGSDVSGFKI